jgi:hypothetical protein
MTRYLIPYVYTNALGKLQFGETILTLANPIATMGDVNNIRAAIADVISEGIQIDKVVILNIIRLPL